MRTFVFISGIPDFLLQPIFANEKEGGNGVNGQAASKSLARSKFDSRFERLRRLLVEHSAGVMLTMHLESKGYALALYASEGEALAACKADITPEQPGRKYPPLRLRIIEREKPRPPEPVYNPYLSVEGEEVAKVDLADTRGLELVYRGRAVAKWCPRTLAGEDCFFGVSCLKLHRAAVQKTVRKRPRIDEDDAAAASHTVEGRTTKEQQIAVKRLLSSIQEARTVLAPPTLAMCGCTSVPVSVEEMKILFDLMSPEPVQGTASQSCTPLLSDPTYQSVLQRVEAALTSHGGPTNSTSSSPHQVLAWFPRLSCSGGAPWNWTLESEQGLALLRQRCPLPLNGAPTPLERDLYTQRLWYHMNQLNQCRSAQEVLRMLCCSRRVQDALRRYEEEAHSEKSGLAVAPPSAADEKATGTLSLCLEPWLYLPTVGVEVTAYIERGGRQIRGVLQRYAQLRLMTSATLLAGVASPPKINMHNTDSEYEDVNQLLSRYAVLDASADAVAEDSLAKELRVLQRSFADAVSDIALHLQARQDAIGGDAAAWCVHLAAVLDPSVALTAGPPPAVRLLSVSPYHQALEECPMYSALKPRDSKEDVAAKTSAATAPPSRPTRVEVTWNTQRHPHIPLFPRELLEKLRVGTGSP